MLFVLLLPVFVFLVSVGLGVLPVFVLLLICQARHEDPKVG